MEGPAEVAVLQPKGLYGSSRLGTDVFWSAVTLHVLSKYCELGALRTF